jgi:hypothetical protein
MLVVHRALVTCIHTHVMCVPRNAKVICTLTTLNHNTVQTFQEVLTVATETLIPCFGMFVRSNIVVSIMCIQVTSLAFVLFIVYANDFVSIYSDFNIGLWATAEYHLGRAV